jgi:hypothetical protein
MSNKGLLSVQTYLQRSNPAASGDPRIGRTAFSVSLQKVIRDCKFDG